MERQCAVLFAFQTLDRAAQALGHPSPQACGADSLAKHLETSVAAVEQARMMRFDPSSQASARLLIQEARPGSAPRAAAPGQGGQAPQASSGPSSPSESGAEASSPQQPSSSAPKPKAKRASKKAAPPPPDSLPVVDAPPASPEESSAAFSANLTTGEVEHVTWPGFPPLFSPPEGATPVMQLVFWSQPLERWVWLVSRPTGRQIPEGVCELTWAQVLQAGAQSKLGGEAVSTALRGLLGLR